MENNSDYNDDTNGWLTPRSNDPFKPYKPDEIYEQLKRSPYDSPRNPYDGSTSRNFSRSNSMDNFNDSQSKSNKKDKVLYELYKPYNVYRSELEVTDSKNSAYKPYTKFILGDINESACDTILREILIVWTKCKFVICPCLRKKDEIDILRDWDL